MPGNFHSIPPSVLATWPPPNYINPVRRSWMPAFAMTWQIASSVTVLSRLYVRIQNRPGAFGIDDFLVLAAWIVSVGFTTLAWLDAAQAGMDRHTWDVPYDEWPRAVLYGWLAQILFYISTCATKLSVLLFFRRLVKGTCKRIWIHLAWVAIGVTVAYLISTIITLCLICQPLNAYWLSYRLSPPYTDSYTCINGNAFTLASGILSIASDCYAVTLPLLMLKDYKVQITRRQKIALHAVFCLGYLICGVGIARTYFLWKLNHTYDGSWTGFDLFMWSIVECQLAIICACVPSLRAFLGQILGKTLEQSRASITRSHDTGKTAAQVCGSYEPEQYSLTTWQGVPSTDGKASSLKSQQKVQALETV